MHQDNRRWPDFDQLYDKAKDKGIGVELHACSTLHGDYRHLERIRLRRGNVPLAGCRIVNGDLDAAARALFQTVPLLR